MFSVLAGFAAAASEVPGKPPNFVFIMADDLGYGDLGCYGQSQIETPNIDLLAAEGMRFTQAYAGSCVCAASRSVLMTGRHNGHGPARDNVPHYHTYLQEDDVTFAEVLQDAGYRCGGVGKWSLGDAGTVGRATNQGFDMWLGYLNQDHAHYYFTEYLDDGEGRLDLKGNATSHQHYSHDLMTERALDFIRTAQAEPFFLYAAYTVPHRSAGSEDETRFPVPSDAPYTDRDWTQAEKNYAAMITRLDRDVGRIVRLIDESDLSDQTLVIFTSDNGPLDLGPQRFDSNGRLRGYKAQLYEGGIRVPLIVRWPGQIPAGTTSDAIVGFQDVLPTLAELAGVEPPNGCDGISMTAALQDKPLTPPHEFLYWDYGHCRGRYDQAVRLGDWKGVRQGVGGRIELYDLAEDPQEARDVADDHRAVVYRIERIMATAATPSPRYPIGEVYTGKPIWRAPGR